jgi:hypothetical protein
MYSGTWRSQWPSSVGLLITCACFAYLHVRPVGHNYVLLPVLAILGLVAVVTVLARRELPARQTAVALGAILAVGVFGTLLGLANPGVSNGALVWIVAPLLFGFWTLSGDEKLLKALFATSAYATIAISVAILLYIGGKQEFIPQFIPLIIQDQGGFSFDSLGDNSTSISFYGLSTLVAAAPIWLTASILPRHRLLPHKAVSIAAALTATVATMVSGRAALTVVTLVVPAVIWAIWRMVTPSAPKSRLRRIAPVAAVAAVGATIALLGVTGNNNVTIAFARLVSVVTGQNQSLSERIRGAQAGRLIEEWLDSPIIGHGFGAIIRGYSRSDNRPWDFELQYQLILFQVGIVGAALVVVGVAAAVQGGVLAMRRDAEMTPVLLVSAAGAIAMGIANASNPYLQAPGHMWAVYLALMVVNVALVKRRTATKVDLELHASPKPATKM